MSKTNDDFIREYILSPAYGRDQENWSKRFHHGSLSYQANVLYSYSCAIAAKFWHNGTEYIAVSFDDYHSTTTSRHTNTVAYNVHRNYSDSQILPVYSVSRLFNSAGEFLVDELISDCKSDLEDLEDTDQYLLCSSWKRSQMAVKIRTLRSLLVVAPELDTYIDRFLKVYNTVDTVEKRDKIRRDHEAEIRAREATLKNDVHEYVLESEDLLFDYLLMNTGSLENADQRIRSLLDAVHTTTSDKLRELLDNTSYIDIRNYIANDIGFYVEFTYMSCGNIRGCAIKFNCTNHNGFTDAYSGTLIIRLDTLFRKYTEDGFDFSVAWNNTQAGYTTQRLSKCSATFYPKNGGYGFACQDGAATNTFIPQAVFDLLHKFVTTCREKFGAIAYPDYAEEVDEDD